MRRVEIDEQEVDDTLTVTIRDARGNIVEHRGDPSVPRYTPGADLRLVASIASGQVPLTQAMRGELARVTDDSGNMIKAFVVAFTRYGMSRALDVSDYIVELGEVLKGRVQTGEMADADLLRFLALGQAEQKVLLDQIQGVVAGRTPMEPPIIEEAQSLHLHYHKHGPDFTQMTPTRREKLRNLSTALMKAVEQDAIEADRG